LFLPDLAKIMRFDTAIFLDKELIALMSEASGDGEGETDGDHYGITDALVLIQIDLNGKPEWILIHWEQIGENPLAAAYLPLTDYPKKERPVIKARAMKGISGIPEGQKRATLYSLIQESIRLDSNEERQFRELVRTNPIYKEVRMLQSVREVGIEEGIEIGIEKGVEIGIEKGVGEGIEKGRFQALEETAVKMLSSGVLTQEQIAQFTGLEISRIRKLAKAPASERQIH
ncbi:MAG: hypothetical protein B6245_24365, partial [Desulfobacteraceae bacterium 4572_88]